MPVLQTQHAHSDEQKLTVPWYCEGSGSKLPMARSQVATHALTRSGMRNAAVACSRLWQFRTLFSIHLQKVKTDGTVEITSTVSILTFPVIGTTRTTGPEERLRLRGPGVDKLLKDNRLQAETVFSEMSGCDDCNDCHVCRDKRDSYVFVKYSEHK